MYRLIEIVKNASNGHESQSITDFENEVSATGEFEFKSGQAAKSSAYIAYCYVLLNSAGEVVDNLFGSTSPEVSICPRLLDVVFSGSNETENLSKYYTMADATANYHSKLGTAMKDSAKNGIMLCLIDEKGNPRDKINWVRPVEPSNE